MKRVNSGSKRRLILFFSIFVMLLGYVSYSTFCYWKQILINKKETKELEKQYDKLLTDEKELEGNVIKLQDPDYVARYAREKYLYTKDGELIIKIIEENK